MVALAGAVHGATEVGADRRKAAERIALADKKDPLVLKEGHGTVGVVLRPAGLEPLAGLVQDVGHEEAHAGGGGRSDSKRTRQPAKRELKEAAAGDVVCGRWRFMSGGKHFDSFHGDCAGGAAHRAQSAADAARLILDDGGLLAPSGHPAVAGEEGGLQFLVAPQVGDIHQAQAELRADVRAAAAQDALVAVEDGPDVAFQAAVGLPPRVGLGKVLLDLGDADAPVERQRRRRAPRRASRNPASSGNRGCRRWSRAPGAVAAGTRPVRNFEIEDARLLALGDRGDDDARAEGGIASCKHIGARGRHAFADQSGSSRGASPSAGPRAGSTRDRATGRSPARRCRSRRFPRFPR